MIVLIISERGSVTRDDGIKLGTMFLEGNRDRIIKGAIVGSILRNHPTVKDVDVLIVPKEGVLEFPIPDGINLFKTPLESWECSVLHWATGRAIIGIKAKAKLKGMTLNQYGLFDAAGTVITREVSDVCKLLDVMIPEPVEESLDGHLVLVNIVTVKTNQEIDGKIPI